MLLIEPSSDGDISQRPLSVHLPWLAPDCGIALVHHLCTIHYRYFPFSGMPLKYTSPQPSPGCVCGGMSRYRNWRPISHGQDIAQLVITIAWWHNSLFWGNCFNMGVPRVYNFDAEIGCRGADKISGEDLWLGRGGTVLGQGRFLIQMQAVSSRTSPSLWDPPPDLGTRKYGLIKFLLVLGTALPLCDSCSGYRGPCHHPAKPSYDGNSILLNHFNYLLDLKTDNFGFAPCELLSYYTFGYTLMHIVLESIIIDYLKKMNQLLGRTREKCARIHWCT